MGSHRLLALPLAVTLGMVLAGCGSTPAANVDSGAAATARTQAAADMTISAYKFTALTVKPGQEVTVANADNLDHTVTLATGGVDVRVPGHGSVTFTAPTRPGTYVMTCDFHTSMRSTLTVEG
ncbi:MAG: cupredoxin domain-containing protein [Candidatus Nanopelagicales bacterium]